MHSKKPEHGVAVRCERSVHRTDAARQSHLAGTGDLALCGVALAAIGFAFVFNPP
jgi:hypothetical protein